MGSHGASWGGAAYDRARESFSNPLMRRCESQYRFATLHPTNHGGFFAHDDPRIGSLYH